MVVLARRVKIGDVYSIKLPNDEYAFVRVFQGPAIGVYKQRGSAPDDVPEADEYDFFVYVYKHVYRKWHYIQNKPFNSDDDSWPPPFCWVDQITGEGSVYYRCEKRSCTYEECKDLEILAVWDEIPLIDRLMGNPKWQNAMKKSVPKL